MPSITYVEANGTEHTVEVAVGTSLMQGAVDHAVPGIEGDCGGQCACATCHVYVPDEWRGCTGEAGELEAAMLEFAFGVDETSRLACQIRVTDAMHGLRVQMPERQY
ncbi:MAG TPA: 2Fe-2S iron-sulfur cluster-binding protein [Pseudomonadales bacterium]